MIYLSDDRNSQEDMEAWLGQLSDPNFSMVKNTILSQLKPRLVTCDFQEKTAEFAFDVMDWQLNPEGGLHGGILVTGFDVSFGLLTHYFAKQHMVSTVQIGTNFLKPVGSNDTVHFQVKITSLGRRIVSLTGEAWLERDHILAATSSATFMKLEKTFSELV